MKMLYKIVHRIENIEGEELQLTSERDVTSYRSKEFLSELLVDYRDALDRDKEVVDQVYDEDLLISYSYVLDGTKHTLCIK